MKNVAVIGLGNIATRHRKNIRALFPQAKIYAVPSSGRLVTEIISDCDEIATDITQLGNCVDMVIVASPAPFHARHAVSFIEAGVPVLIEKPVAASLEDGMKLLSAYKDNKTPVAVGYCLRYMPSAKILHEQLKSGVIGKLLNADIAVGQYLPDWRKKDYRESVSAQRKLGGGALLELSHELDYTRWLLGELHVQHAIVRHSGTLDINVEDLVDVVAVAEQNVVVNIHLDFLQRKAYRKCAFIGAKGRLEWDLITNSLVLSDASGTKVIYVDEAYDRNQLYLEMLKDFIRLIAKENNNCITLEDAVATVELIEQINNTAN
ncbi:Gfo/Idh/MocA family protein [Kosakonia cowanii]|uniref:Gfo/Idh/MocA family protein n=1 Tax=Kosakonia cowanii TaxID=208223 RepID=UPI003B21F362